MELRRAKKEDLQKALKWFREQEFPLLKRLAEGDPNRMAEIKAFEREVEASFAHLSD